jgi:argininosuccinate lyase
LPQKKNPYALTWIRACANEAIGVQAGVAASGRTPSGQIDNRLLAYGEVPRMLDRGAGAAALAAAVVRGLTVDRARGGQLMTQSFIVATDLAEVLVVESGLDHRAAQRVVGVLARMLATSGRRSASLDSADVNAAAIEVTGSGAELDNAALTRALDAARAVSAREGPGGAAAAPMTEMLSACRAELASATTFCVESRARAEHARLALLARASAAAEGA